MNSDLRVVPPQPNLYFDERSRSYVSDRGFSLPEYVAKEIYINGLESAGIQEHDRLRAECRYRDPWATFVWYI